MGVVTEKIILQYQHIKNVKQKKQDGPDNDFFKHR